MYGGNLEGVCCMFLFMYNGDDYNSCINVDSSRLWCVIMKDYDIDNKWGYCGSK